MERIPDFRYTIGRYSILVMDDFALIEGRYEDMRPGVQEIFSVGKLKETKYESFLYFQMMESIHLYTKLTILDHDSEN